MEGTVEIICNWKKTELPFTSVKTDKRSLIESAFNKVEWFNDFTRHKYISKKILWYNEIVNFKIEYDGKLIVDTSEQQFASFQHLLKFNNSRKSREGFIGLLVYLSTVNDSELIFSSFDNESNKELNELVKLNDISDVDKLIMLTEFQKALLCSGMEEAEPRQLYKNFIANNSFSEEELKLVDQYIRIALKKYGKELLFKCLELPKKPFKIQNTKRLFSQFDRGQKMECSAIKIISKSGEEIELFFRKDENKISVRNSFKKVIMTIDVEGNCKSLDKENNHTSTIVLLLSMSNNPLQQIVYYGSQTGKCSYCGSPLTNPTSLQYGYGKICGQNHNLAWR